MNRLAGSDNAANILKFKTINVDLKSYKYWPLLM